MPRNWAEKYREEYEGAKATSGMPMSGVSDDPEAWHPTTTGGVVLVTISLLLVASGVYGLVRHMRYSVPVLATGLVTMCLVVLAPSGLHLHILPHAHWLWAFVLFVPWFMAVIIPTGIDDAVFYGLVALATVGSFVLRGIFGSMSPSSAAWMLLACTWILVGARRLREPDVDARPYLQVFGIGVGWYLLAVLA